jgi:hypothetical protein
MSRLKPPTGLEHFIRLNPSVYYHEPIQNTKSPSSAGSTPDLILLLGWMDAQPKHLSKYSSMYEKLYPSSRIVIVTTNSLDALIRSTSANLNRIAPVLEILYSIPENSVVKVLLHLFSNGGGITSTLIARTYREKMGRELPLRKMVLDSSPGRPDVTATRRAFAVAFPKNPILYFIGNVLFTLIFVCIKLYYASGISVNPIEQLRRDLNDRKLFGIDVERLYVFSKGDTMVEARHVEEHAAEAERMGFRVDLEKYSESGHAAHMLSDPKRYWEAIETLWASVT